MQRVVNLEIGSKAEVTRSKAGDRYWAWTEGSLYKQHSGVGPYPIGNREQEELFKRSKLCYLDR